MITVTAGDDINIRATLLIDGVKENITGYTVKAAIVYPDKITIATGTSVVTATIVDAVNGSISATWPRATTAAIVPGMYLIEIQSDTGTARTTYDRIPITVDAGVIA